MKGRTPPLGGELSMWQRHGWSLERYQRSQREWLRVMDNPDVSTEITHLFGNVLAVRRIGGVIASPEMTRLHLQPIVEPLGDL